MGWYATSKNTGDTIEAAGYNALLNDIKYGAVWDTAATNNIRMQGSATASAISTTAGPIYLKPASFELRYYYSATKYLQAIPLAASAGLVMLNNLGRIETRSYTGVFRFSDTAITNYLQMEFGATDIILRSYTSGQINIVPYTHILRVGVTGTRAYLELYDTVAAAFKKISIVNSVVTVT